VGGHDGEFLAGRDPSKEMRAQSQSHDNVPGLLTKEHALLAQDVVSGQGFRLVPCQRRPDCGRGCRQTGQSFSPGLTSRLALHFGQVILISLMPFSWLMFSAKSGASNPAWSWRYVDIC
jgi:hypothetical protein